MLEELGHKDFELESSFAKPGQISDLRGAGSCFIFSKDLFTGA